MILRTLLLACCAALVLSGCQKPEKKFTLAVTHAKIWTGNPLQPWAQAALVAGDTLFQIGTDEEIAPLLEQTIKVIDAGGRLVVPGFIDSHAHTIMGGNRLTSVQLKNINTQKDFITAIGNYAKTLKPGEWILGGDWDHQHWGGELPTHEWIDSVTRDNPVWVERSEGHSGLSNQLALTKAGILKSTKDIDGGMIVRDKNGVPTGVLKDNAMELIFKAIPDLSDAQKQLAIEGAMEYYLREGVTSVHHMVEPHERNLGGVATDYAAFKKIHDEGKLNVRFYIAEPFTDWEKVATRIKSEGAGDKWLKSGALKGYVDGAIGSHSALFYDDYTDKKGFRGSQVTSDAVLYQLIKGGNQAGLQVFIHAIGDEAIHKALTTFEKVTTENGAVDPRFRIEHTQHIAPADMAYMKKLNVIASMQPYHAIDDGIWVEQAIGPERIKTTYAIGALMKEGVHVTFGSDWFVAPPSPLKGMFAAVTRRTLDGKNPEGWVPEQKIGLEEALVSYTREGAYASFDEKIKGTLETGKLADMVILEKNIFEIDPVELFDAKVDATIVGGKVVYDRGKIGGK